MHMSHLSADLQEHLTRLHKPTMDPTPNNPNPNTRYQNDAVFADDKEPMFEKALTPSDVGKLNRLVIPKQHAEKYFPLAGGGDPAGTLLDFEDEAGKCWRFRYSYWNSSQSYVLTKGWSRYVKEKRLDAGDIVFFQRHRAEPERLFIGWRRRGSPPPQPMSKCSPAFRHNSQGQGGGGVVGIPAYQSNCRYSGEGPAKQEQKATPGSGSSTSNNNTTKRLVRLFGVNLECQLSDSSSQTTSSRGSSQLNCMSSQQQQRAYHNYFN